MFTMRRGEQSRTVPHIELYQEGSGGGERKRKQGRGKREEDTWRGGTDSGVLLNQGFLFKGKKLYEVKQCRE